VATEGGATYILQLDHWLCPCTVFISPATEEEKKQTRTLRAQLFDEASVGVHKPAGGLSAPNLGSVSWWSGENEKRVRTRDRIGILSSEFPVRGHDKRVAIVGEGTKRTKRLQRVFRDPPKTSH